MRPMVLFLTAALSILFSSSLAFAKIVGQPVEYSAQGKTMKGYLAYDDSLKGKRPGILVVHEWWGMNEYARQRANMLAGLGYTALAADMYGEGKTAFHPEDAGRFSSEVMKNFEIAKARFQAAEEFLKNQQTVDPQKIGAVGYCFGGGVVLNIAAQGEDLKGTVVFHGSLQLVQPPVPGKVKSKILVLHGGKDKFSSAEQVTLLQKQMKEAGADYRMVVYPDAMHAFTNPEATENGKKFNIPLAYDENADKASWQEMKNFFNSNFGR